MGESDSSGPTIKVVIYTTGDECVQCKLTKDVLDAVGLTFVDYDLTDPANASAREYVTDDLGYSSAPVVVVDDHDHWAGFQPVRIRELARRIGEREDTGE